MSRIFCLETEWTQSIHDLKDKSTVHSLLEFIEGTLQIQYVFRQVATLEDFDYYIRHLQAASYAPYDLVYLCFNGTSGAIAFAEKSEYQLSDFAKEHKGIFKDRTVIFDSCSTLNLDEEDIQYFKKTTGARMVIGYRKRVDFIKSFVFEFWLLTTIISHPDFGPKRLSSLADREMPTHVASLGFVCY